MRCSRLASRLTDRRPPLAPRRSAALAAERRRREETEAKLIRALENNGALARVNLRLQEQCARLRGEADLRQHEEGCQRTAAAVREREAAAKLARLQALVQQGEQERAALRRQLAGKQEVIAYLEGKLAERVAGSRLGGSGAGQLGARAGGSSGAVDAASGPQAADTAASSGSGGSAVSADTAAVREVQRRVPRVASEVEEARQEGDGQASASSSPTASCVADELEAADAAAAAGGGGRTAAAGAAAVAAADEEAQQLRPPQPASPVAPTAAVTPAPQKAAQQQADEFRCGGLHKLAWSFGLWSCCAPRLPFPACTLNPAPRRLPCPAAPAALPRPPPHAPRCGPATASATQSPA